MTNCAPFIGPNDGGDMDRRMKPWQQQIHPVAVRRIAGRIGPGEGCVGGPTLLPVGLPLSPARIKPLIPYAGSSSVAKRRRRFVNSSTASTKNFYAGVGFPPKRRGVCRLTTP